MSKPTWVSDLQTVRPLIGQDVGFPRDVTAPMLLKAFAEKRKDRTAFVSAEGRRFSALEFYMYARRVAKGLIAANVEPKQGVCILGANSVEWFAADWGSLVAGVLPAPSYVSNSAQIVAYIMDHSTSIVCFVDDEESMIKAIAAKAQTSRDSVRHIVVWGNNIDLSKYQDHASYLLTWDEFLANGDSVSEASVDARMTLARPESCAKLIYTSGTTGPPKAVMISHDNLYFIGRITIDQYQICDTDTTVSYLPASHIAANSLDCMGPVFCGVTVYLAKPDALRGSLVDCLKAVRPTCFYAVPRVWEKIQERMVGMRANMGPLKLAISDWAKSIGSAASNAEDSGGTVPLWTPIADRVVFANVRKALGLDRARLIFNTAAPLQPSTNAYFRSLHLKLLDVYGMSEGTGSFTMATPDCYKSGSVGRPCAGMEVKLDRKDNDSGEGELCFRGRNVFMGYLGDPEETRVAMDDDGYIHTGDLAKIDSDGFIFITGRAKELMITAGGENVAPALIEKSLLSAMPAISRAFAVGDARKYCSCLLVPHMDENGNLVGPAANVSESVTVVDQIKGNSAWDAYLAEGMAKANTHAISNVAKVKKSLVLWNDFSVEPRPGYERGELTPTLKVRRKVVLENCKKEIDTLY